MPRPKGLPKTGGRLPGSRNKTPSIASIQETLDQHGFNIVAEAIQLYHDPDMPLAGKLSVLKLLAQYALPIPKPVEPEPDTPAIEVEYSPLPSDGLLSIAEAKE